MAEIRVLYINSDSFQQEHSEVNDSIKMFSFKTANKELTDAKLAHLVDGADANNEHIHDTRYFRSNQHISTSTGAGDAAKPVVTSSNGKFDNSLIDATALNPNLDHGVLTGLGDDDHLQYIRVDGTRDFTGVQKYSVHPSFNDDKQLVDKKYVDDLYLKSEWYPKSALTYILDNTLAPPTTAEGDVYVLSHNGGVPNAGWGGAVAGDIVERKGGVWVVTTPTAGTRIGVDDEASVVFYLYSGTMWAAKYGEVSTASNGLIKTGFDIQIDPLAAGNGLSFSSGIFNVNTDNSSIEINADTLRVKALGIKDSMLDFGTGAGQISAVDLPIADTASLFPTDNVESALEYLAQQIIARGVSYTSAAAGVTKGDLLYISASNTVAKYTNLAVGSHCVGLALETVAGGLPIKSLANDTIVTGVLTGAVPGSPIYWDGSGYVNSIPTTAGANVWQVGVAKNSTDLHVEIRHIKKNA